MAKKSKSTVVKGHIFNIKLVSNERKSEEVLLDLFKKIKNRKIKKKVSPDREAAIRQLFVKDLNFGQIAYGKFSSAIELGNEAWLNEENMEPEEFTGVPKHMKPKLRDSEYVLVPKAHRLFLKSSTNNVTVNQVKKFLNGALNDVIKEDEEIEIFVQKDKEGITRILEANTVNKLQVVITKTNNDLTEDFAEMLDNELGDANIETYNATFIPKDKSVGLNINTPLIKAPLDLAVENGNAKATITDESGNKQIVRTDDYERKYSLNIQNPDNINEEIAQFIFKNWRQ